MNYHNGWISPEDVMYVYKIRILALPPLTLGVVSTDERIVTSSLRRCGEPGY